MADETVLLRGGSRDGETTSRDSEVTRLLAASPAPGLLEVYEETEGVAPELIHMQVVGREGED